MSLSSHQSTRMLSEDWLTPPEIIRALGDFDLDPCCPQNMPWKTATNMLTKADDGLAADWSGRIWLNPPFGNKASIWLAKLADHGNGIALVPARTETRWFFAHIWRRAAAVLFMEGRPHFHKPDGSRAKANSGAPICLAAYGKHNVDALKSSGLGALVTRWYP